MLNQRRAQRELGKLVKRVSALESEVEKLKDQIDKKAKQKNKG